MSYEVVEEAYNPTVKSIKLELRTVEKKLETLLFKEISDREWHEDVLRRKFWCKCDEFK